jgi:two-component system sensor histidine kinase/response regulator
VTEAAPRREIRVLLVEDDEVNQEIESLMLERLGFAVDVVSDGAAAVTAAAEGGYSAILMDCHLPVMDGYRATTAIRVDEAPETHVPIIGLSAYTDRQRCIDAGMDDHLAKPFALDALARALNRAKPPESAAVVESVLDAAVVDQLRSLAKAGNPELLHKLQESFTRDTPVRLAALRAAVAAGDADAVAFNVHTLKGSAANLGAEQIVTTCQRIERITGAPDARELEPLLADLERNAAEAGAELTRLAEIG